MTLNELIEKLTALRDEEGVDGETEVRLAHQPHYPLQSGIQSAVRFSLNQEEIDEVNSSIKDGGLEPEEMEEAKEQLRKLEDENKDIIYLTEGSMDDHDASPYASKSLWDHY